MLQSKGSQRVRQNLSTEQLDCLGLMTTRGGRLALLAESVEHGSGSQRGLGFSVQQDRRFSSRVAHSRAAAQGAVRGQ